MDDLGEWQPWYADNQERIESLDQEPEEAFDEALEDLGEEDDPAKGGNPPAGGECELRVEDLDPDDPDLEFDKELVG
eukprot:8416370-Alexandrium_andersonii.AAC.1